MVAKKEHHDHYRYWQLPHSPPDPPTPASWIQARILTERIRRQDLNSSVSSFVERDNSQHGSTFSTARTSACSTETEGIASTNSASPFCVEGKTKSVGREDILIKTLNFWGNLHNRENILFKFGDYALDSINPTQNVNGITQRFKNTATVMHPINYLKNRFPKFHTPGNANCFRKSLPTQYNENIGYQNRTLTMTTSKKKSDVYNNSRSFHICEPFTTPTCVISNFHRCKNVRDSCRGSTIRKIQQFFFQTARRQCVAHVLYLYLIVQLMNWTWVTE